MIKSLLLVGIGGGLGSICRYLIYESIQNRFSSNFPIATFTINIIGSIFIGLLLGYLGKSTNYSPEIKWLLMTGFCGGFTTFSALSAENFQLIQSGQYWTCIFYSLLSITVGIIAVGIGWTLSK